MTELNATEADVAVTQCPVAHGKTARVHGRLPLPPGPKGMPIVGVAPNIMRDPFGYLPKLVRRYGDIVTVPFPAVRIILVSNADYVNRVFNGDPDVYSHYHEIAEVAGMPGGPKPLPVLEGQQWKRHRGVMHKPFTERKLKAATPVITAALEHAITAWDRMADTGEWIEMQHEIGIVTMSALMHSMFGGTWNDAQIADWVERTLEHGKLMARSMAIYPLFWRLPKGQQIYLHAPIPLLNRGRRNLQVMKRLVDDMIVARKATPTDSSDVLNQLLGATFDDGTTFTYEELRSEMITLLFAGFDTTAAVLSWTLGLLALNPHECDKAYAEVDALARTSFGYGDLPQLTYLRACFDEAQRLQGAPFNARFATQDDEIDGYRVPKGAIVITSLHAMHRDHRYWNKPEEFRPERFLGDDIDKYAFMPFGVGPRRCLGMRMAYLEGVSALANILARYHFEVPGGWQPKHSYHLSTGLKTLPMRLYRR
ncbi:cytochrome P450 [Mycobacterium sp. shizuoka-1]|uniref:cytochrome P450 n=1 Tax=Mycobacterium sp. shizuoka-1 TaxID=2039281 RepID=UPI000C065007|nr:cytochrome P450 [Mycobacterium sp. shizuoka-1]GAY13862.1 putative cytochrome P450 [Mycobacterium sp. shizuoka-1]